MSPSTPVGLLATHVRALEATVASSPVAHEKFEWRMLDGAWAGPVAKDQLPTMVHIETGFLFAIEYHEPWQDEFGAGGPAEFRYRRAPGVQGYAETIEAKSWDEVVFDFRLWLRLIAREIGRHEGSEHPPRDRDHSRADELWALLHPDVRSAARRLFEIGRYSAAAQAAFSHIDASSSFSPTPTPVLSGLLAPPPADADVTAGTAIHFLFLASLLRYKLDETSAMSRPEGTTD